MECGCPSAVLAARHSEEVDEGQFGQSPVVLRALSESEALGKVKGPPGVQHEWSPALECSPNPQPMDWTGPEGAKSAFLARACLALLGNA